MKRCTRHTFSLIGFTEKLGYTLLLKPKVKKVAHVRCVSPCNEFRVFIKINILMISHPPTTHSLLIGLLFFITWPAQAAYYSQI